MRVLGIITARGGSKGIPRKNIRLLAGKPLLQYTAEAALSAKRLHSVILSTEDPEIAEVGRRCGLDVPFMRPAELAQDESPTLQVLQHAVRFLENEGSSYNAICLLQPTNPLRQSSDIDACIELLDEAGVDSVVTVLPVPSKYNPHWVYFRSAEGCLQLCLGESVPIPRRQLLPAAFHRDGSVYITRREVLLEQNTLYGMRVRGYLMDPARSVNIDTMNDWREAESMLIQKVALPQSMIAQSGESVCLDPSAHGHGDLRR